MKPTYLAVLSAAVIILGCASPTESRWEATQRVTIVGDRSDANIHLEIPATQSRPAYTLDCHSWDFEGDIDYSGIVQCWFRKPQERGAANLLSENDSDRSWDNRSRFLAHHLVGRCASDPQWGANRTYYAAGLKVQIDITSVEMKGADIAKYTINARVSDASGQSPVALSPRPDWFDRGPCPN